MYNEPKKNKKGQPVCEICHVAYDRLLQHVNLRHGISSMEYKLRYNLNPKKGIQSGRLTSRMSKTAKRNYNTVIMQNLIIGGRQTRFKEGNTFTNRNHVSTASKTRMLKKREETKANQASLKEQLITDIAKRIERLVF